MAADAFTPRTTKQRLPTPLNGTLYITTRLVAQEKPFPAIGGTMEAELGPAWADSIVIGVSEPPENSKGVLAITHVRIPSEADQLASNWEQVQVPVGGTLFPGVVRSVILPAADYAADSPAIGSPLPVIDGGLFDGDGYTLYDRDCTKSGIKLEPTFRVDRRTYVKLTTLVGEAYGDIVTQTITERLVPDGTVADTGFDVISSVMTPLGSGKSIRRTERAKSPGWPDPLEKEKSKETPSMVPQKWRGQVTRTKKTRKIAPSAIPEAITLTGDVKALSYKLETPDRAEETKIEEVVSGAQPTFTGSVSYVERVKGTISESYIPDGAPADTGLYIVDSRVTPQGDGRSVKETVSVPSWPTFKSLEWDSTLSAGVEASEQFVTPPSSFPGDEENTSYRPVNADRSLKIVKTIPTAALNALHHIFPTEEQVRLPDVLLSASILVSRVVSNGNSIASGTSASMSCSSSVSLAPDINYEIEEGYSGSVPAEIHVFYLPGSASTAQILTKCNASAWPQYKPRASRVVISGHGLSKSVSRQVSDGGESISEHSEIQAFTQAVAFPSSLHGTIPLTITYHDYTAPTSIADTLTDDAIARAEQRNLMLLTALSKGQRMFGMDTTIPENYAAVLNLISKSEDQITFTADLAAADFTVTASPGTLPATNHATVQTGRFLKSSVVRDYDYGYVQVTATVVIIS